MGWSILNSEWDVSNNKPYSWKITELVAKTQAYSWYITAFVSKAQVYSWNIWGYVSKALAYSWQIRGLIGRALAYSWKIYTVLSGKIVHTFGKRKQETTLHSVGDKPNIKDRKKSRYRGDRIHRFMEFKGIQNNGR